MKSRKMICFCILTMVMLITANNILAETAASDPIGFTAENAVVTEPQGQLFCYDVTYRNLHKAYKPETFNSSGVKSREYQRLDGRETEDWINYLYEDGAELCIPTGLSLMYGDTRREQYSQVLTYLRSEPEAAECVEIEGFSLEEAQKKADAFIAGLGIEYLEPDTAVSLSHDYLDKITGDMREAYVGMDKVRYFDTFTTDIDAYYLTYRQVLNGIKTAGDPQAAVVITRDGIAYLEMAFVIDGINDKQPVSEGLTRQAAADLCAERCRKEFSLLPGNINISNEIAEISVVNYFAFNESGEDEYRASLFPCWFLKGTQTFFKDGEAAGRKHIRDLYRIQDGQWFYAN